MTEKEWIEWYYSLTSNHQKLVLTMVKAFKTCGLTMKEACLAAKDYYDARIKDKF